MANANVVLRACVSAVFCSLDHTLSIKTKLLRVKQSLDPQVEAEAQ